MVCLLQRYDGLSDADAVDSAENDRRWQLVLGTLGRDEAPFGQGTLVRFRTRMITHDLDKKLVDRTVELAKKTGGFGWKNVRVALDSSP
ncbi:MAG: transposase, partial [bacterium]|nr:transposase [bacterium]